MSEQTTCTALKATLQTIWSLIWSKAMNVTLGFLIWKITFMEVATAQTFLRSTALKRTKQQQAWDLLSPSLDLNSRPEPQKNDSSLPEEENLEEGEASSDEELHSVTFQSKYINIFPLYQDYSLQAIGDGIQKLKDGILSDPVKSESVYGLFSYLRASNHLEGESPFLTPDSTSPSPTFFHGRRSALRRHSQFGVESPHQSADSISTESCSNGRASTLSVGKRLEFEDPSPTQPPSIRLTSCTLWQDLEEVKASGLPNILTPKEIGLQESMFELIGSEVSYLKSLGVLVNHFYASKVLKKTMSTVEHRTLFCNIRHVMEANTRFLLDLEARLGEGLVIFQVGDIVLQHCGNFKQHYVPYVTNMTYQESLVNQLMQQNKNFVYALKKLEREPVCQRQGLKSFLILPFQRITRLKLLLEGILKLTEPDSEAASNLSKAIKSIHEIVLECDQKVEKMKRLEELIRLETLMDFDDIKLVPLVKSTRFLVLHGPLYTLVTYGSKLSTVRIYLHLFNDLLIVSSKKYERFAVLDYAVFPEHVTVLANKVLGLPVDSFLLNLAQSQMGPPTTIILIASKSYDKEVWIKALSNK
ncbi:rho guanine nucleotide exchange factor 19 isoform X2 [Poeciliopsis prolifica]|uniref:rho guanine nucleotide exchange factor 19 isoform X2 n=1 Tax=Poeciliopsis prolifica TaxID=188132 RepID=UPI002412EC19|nr:rho guanine nucleotide exchange factor 19 isoform X2 [Poeciliopsis prolifica]